MPLRHLDFKHIATHCGTPNARSLRVNAQIRFLNHLRYSGDPDIRLRAGDEVEVHLRRKDYASGLECGIDADIHQPRGEVIRSHINQGEFEHDGLHLETPQATLVIPHRRQSR